MISPLAYIHPEAKIGENVEIGPFVFIDKNVVIGDNNTIMPNVLEIIIAFSQEQSSERFHKI